MVFFRGNNAHNFPDILPLLLAVVNLLNLQHPHQPRNVKWVHSRPHHDPSFLNINHTIYIYITRIVQIAHRIHASKCRYLKIITGL